MRRIQLILGFLIFATSRLLAENYDAISVQGRLDSTDTVHNVLVDILGDNDTVLGSASPIALVPDANGIFSTSVTGFDPKLFLTGDSGYSVKFTKDGVIISTFSIGSVPFAFAVKGGSLNGNILGAHGNIGIGTTAPVSKFDVVDGSITVRGAGAGVIFENAGRILSPETNLGLGAGIKVSTNIYIVGFSSAAKYYGDGSALTGVTASEVAADKILPGALGPVVIASSVAVNSVYTDAIQAGAVNNTHITDIDAAKIIGTLSPFAGGTGVDSAGWTGLARVDNGIWSPAGINPDDLPGFIDATKLADGTVDNIRFQYLNTVTSDIQPQFDALVLSTAPLANAANWDIAYGWGNHAGAGYASGITLNNIITSTGAIQTSLDAVAADTGTLTIGLAAKAVYNDVSVDTTTIANNVVGKETADVTIVKEADLTTSDFNAAGNVVSIDYTNGQAAAAGVKGFLTGADWDTFNGKLATTGSGSGLSGIITSTQVIMNTLGSKLDATGDGSGLSGVITSTYVIIASLAAKAVYADVIADTTTIANSVAAKADYNDVRVDTTTIATNVAGKETADVTIVKEADLTANDFNAADNVVSIDYANGQAAATGVKGFLTGADWDTFNDKLSPTGNGSGLTGIITSTQVIMNTLGNKLDATGDGSGLSGVITSTDVIIASLAAKAVYADVIADTTTIANAVAAKAVYNDVRIDTTTIANAVAAKAVYNDVRVDTTTLANSVSAEITRAVNRENDLGTSISTIQSSLSSETADRIISDALKLDSTGTLTYSMLAATETWTARQDFQTITATATCINSDCRTAWPTSVSDNLGNHVATMLLTANYGITSSTGINAGYYQIGGSTVMAILKGDASMAVGKLAGASNWGSNNTFTGYAAGNQNTSGTNNSFFGFYAGANNLIVSQSRT